MADIQARDVTNLCHNGGCGKKFVASRVLAKKGGQWAEIGWVEASFEGWQDTRYVYTYSDWDDVWHRHLSYDLVGGNFYRFKIEPSGSSIYQYILWNGFWQAVYNYPRPDCGGRVVRWSGSSRSTPTRTASTQTGNSRINVETAKKHKNGS